MINKNIDLIPYKEVWKHINISRETRRLHSYSIEQLKNVFYFERDKAIRLYHKIDILYDVRKLNFAHVFNLHCLYLEQCDFNEAEPNQDKLVDCIIMFFETQYLIKKYLQKLK